MDRQYRPRDLLIAVFVALLISWALIAIAEYLGWRLVREAGGAMTERWEESSGVSV